MTLDQISENRVVVRGLSLRPCHFKKKMTHTHTHTLLDQKRYMWTAFCMYLVHEHHPPDVSFLDFMDCSVERKLIAITFKKSSTFGEGFYVYTSCL